MGDLGYDVNGAFDCSSAREFQQQAQSTIAPVESRNEVHLSSCLTGAAQNVISLPLDAKPMPSVTLSLGVANSVEGICRLCSLVRNCAHSATNIT